jgi:UDP-2,3-diacylglucosamine hydrolase
MNLHQEGKKTYFVSDVHLGAPALKDNRERELLFVKWLREVGRDAEAIYLMGDIFDYWFEYRTVVPRGFTRVLGSIAALTDQGIPVHFFTGNHDIWVFDYLPAETGIILHKEPFITTIGEHRFFLAHGDGLDASDKGYLLLKRIFTSRTLQWFYARVHPDLTIRLAHRWSKNSRLSKNTGGPEFMGEKEGIYKFALSVLKKEAIDFFIFGHRHRLADMVIHDESRLILLGEWINAFSYGVYDGRRFELKKYVP